MVEFNITASSLGSSEQLGVTGLNPILDSFAHDCTPQKGHFNRDMAAYHGCNSCRYLLSVCSRVAAEIYYTARLAQVQAVTDQQGVLLGLKAPGTRRAETSIKGASASYGEPSLADLISVQRGTAFSPAELGDCMVKAW